MENALSYNYRLQIAEIKNALIDQIKLLVDEPGTITFPAENAPFYQLVSKRDAEYIKVVARNGVLIQSPFDNNLEDLDFEELNVNQLTDLLEAIETRPIDEDE